MVNYEIINIFGCTFSLTKTISHSVILILIHILIHIMKLHVIKYLLHRRRRQAHKSAGCGQRDPPGAFAPNSIATSPAHRKQRTRLPPMKRMKKRTVTLKRKRTHQAVRARAWCASSRQSPSFPLKKNCSP